MLAPCATLLPLLASGLELTTTAIIPVTMSTSYVVATIITAIANPTMTTTTMYECHVFYIH